MYVHTQQSARNIVGPQSNVHTYTHAYIHTSHKKPPQTEAPISTHMNIHPRWCTSLQTITSPHTYATNLHCQQLPAVVHGLKLSQTSRIPPVDGDYVGDIPVGKIEDCAGAAFQSRCWREADFSYFELKKAHRQTDAVFIGQLRRLRLGNLDAETDTFWRSLSRALPESEVLF
jgi:hypothetical protein